MLVTKNMICLFYSVACIYSHFPKYIKQDKQKALKKNLHK